MCPLLRCPACGSGSCNGRCFRFQRVIPEKELGRYLEEGWALNTQLQSGNVVIEKEIDIEKISSAVLEEANKKIAAEVAQADIEKVTENAMEQAKKQIADTVAQEKQRLLKE